jgi:hypothetical protein
MVIDQKDAFQKDKSMIVQGAGLLACCALIGAGLPDISMTVVEPGTGFANPATTPTQMMSAPAVDQQAVMAAPANNAVLTNSISTPQMGMK